MYSWLIRGIGPLGFIALMAFVLWVGLKVTRNAQPTISSSRSALLERLIPDITEDLRHCGGGTRTAVLFTFEGDPGGYLTQELNDSMTANGVFILLSPTLGDRVRALLRLDAAAPEDATDAAQQARSRGAGAAIFGNIWRFESGPDGACLEMQLAVVDAQSARVILVRNYLRQSPRSFFGISLSPTPMTVPTDPAPRPQTTRFSYLGACLWLLGTLLLPLFTVRFLQAMVHSASNNAIAASLALYTITDVLLAAMLWTLFSAAPLPVILLIISGVVALSYCTVVMTYIVPLQT